MTVGELIMRRPLTVGEAEALALTSFGLLTAKFRRLSPDARREIYNAWRSGPRWSNTFLDDPDIRRVIDVAARRGGV